MIGIETVLISLGASLLFILLFKNVFFHGSTGKMMAECPLPSYKGVIEKYVVSTDPSSYFKGTFLDYFSAPYEGVQHCFSNTFTLEDGGIISSTILAVETGGNTVNEYEEKQTVIDPGVYRIDGTDGGKSYAGKLYVLHADEDVLAYYYCRFSRAKGNDLVKKGEDVGYAATVLVKREKVKELMDGSSSDQRLKDSVEEAKRKISAIAEEAKKMTEKDKFSVAYHVKHPTQVKNEHLNC